MAKAHLIHHMLPEHVHLLLREVCLSKYVLNLDESVMQVLVLIP
jgi:hypothetical protein